MPLSVDRVRWVSPPGKRIAPDGTTALESVFLTDAARIFFKDDGGVYEIEVLLTDWLRTLSAFLRLCRAKPTAEVDEIMPIAGERFVAESHPNQIVVECFDWNGGGVKSLHATPSEWKSISATLRAFIVAEAMRSLPPGTTLTGTEQFEA
jgi:hypothetical protein